MIGIPNGHEKLRRAFSVAAINNYEIAIVGGGQSSGANNSEEL